jgi:hypothetical protein
MECQQLVFAVAASYVRRLGAAAPEVLLEQAVIADGLGDVSSAKIWLEIVDMAEEMLMGQSMAS